LEEKVTITSPSPAVNGGTFNQTAPLSQLSKVMTAHSFDLFVATDRFSLLLQFIVVKCLFPIEAAFSQVYSGLGMNVFVTLVYFY